MRLPFLRTRLFQLCLTALLACSAVATSGCARPDAALAADLRSHLDASPALRGASIAVLVKKGVVLLQGHVAERAQAPEAVRVVTRVNGVRKVIDRLTLSDDSIRGAVEQAFRHDPLLTGVPIEVAVTGGVVRLTSTATNAAHRARALAIARAIPDVIRVEDDMK